MAFLKDNFQKITSSLNDAEPRGWSYSTTDSLDTVRTVGYFNDLIGQITAEDFVYIKSSDDTEFFKFEVSGNDLIITTPTKNTINLVLEFTTSGAGIETFTMPVPGAGKIVGATIAVPDGTAAPDNYQFDLIQVGNTIGTINITGASGLGQQFSFVNTPAPIAKTALLNWKKLAGVATPVRIQSYVLLELD